MSDRGMMKWAPFKSLIEQADCLEEMRYKKNRVSKPILTPDQKEKINAILEQYHGQTLIFKFYHDGFFYEISKTIKAIDPYKKVIVFDDGELPLFDIVDITDTDLNFF